MFFKPVRMKVPQLRAVRLRDVVLGSSKIRSDIAKLAVGVVVEGLLTDIAGGGTSDVGGALVDASNGGAVGDPERVPSSLFLDNTFLKSLIL
jgi:hypothetical protein